MAEVLKMIISLVIIVATYVVVSELYNTFASTAYIGTACIVTAGYFAIEDFVDKHEEWPWIVIFAVVLAIAEAGTMFLKKNRKTNRGLTILSCSLAGIVAFSILGLEQKSLFGAIAATIVLICMNMYSFYAVSRRNIAHIHDELDHRTGICEAVFLGATVCVAMEWAYRFFWKGILGEIHIALWISLQIALFVFTVFMAIWIDIQRIKKRTERYMALADTLGAAKAHFKSMVKDVEGVLDSVTYKDRKLAADSRMMSSNMRRFKQLRKTDIELMTFYEYNEMLVVYPKLMDYFDPIDGTQNYGYEFFYFAEPVKEEGEPVAGSTSVKKKPKQEKIMRSVYFRDCNSKSEVEKRYNQLIKAFEGKRHGVDNAAHERLRKEYEEEIRRQK